MKRHLTEKELIEYQFKLASQGRMERARLHLEECTPCREHLEELRQKFAALDLLREDITVSEDLISQVVEQARRPVQPKARPKLVSFRMPASIAAAAAVLLVASLLVVSSLRQPRIEKEKFTEKPRTDNGKLMARAESGRDAGVDPKVAVREKTDGVYGGGLGAAAAHGLLAGRMPEKPPFAPASAIELVTLPRRDAVQITIYNSADLTLVRERRNLTMKEGWNWLQFMWANTLIDPTSLSLEPLAHGDKIDIQQLVFPARLRELGRWLIRSEVSGQVPFEITYFTSGLSWRAFYMGTLARDEKKMHLKSYVRVANSSGEDYEKAQTRLIVGKIHLLDEIARLAKRQYAYNRPGVGKKELDVSHALPVDAARDWGWEVNGEMLDTRLGTLRPKEIKKEGLSEYFLYTIEGTETIPDKWSKRLLSFEAGDIEVESLYKYDQQRWGARTIRFLSFANDEEHNLGETPIPNGNVKIYSQADDAGLLSYVGGTNIKYIPVDEEIELNLGPARLVSVEPTLMNFKTDNFVFDKRKDIAGWDELRTWKMEITNTRTLPIDIEITRGFGTAYWTLPFDEQNISYEKYDATHARFELKLAPRSKRTFEYTVTTYHGVREEALTE